jgi:hypothetical protein
MEKQTALVEAVMDDATWRRVLGFDLQGPKERAAARNRVAKGKAWRRKLAAQEKDLMLKIVGELCLKAAQRRDFGPVLKKALERGTKSQPAMQAFLREKGVI